MMDRPKLDIREGTLTLSRPHGRIDLEWTDSTGYGWRFTQLPESGTSLFCAACGNKIEPGEFVWYSVARDQQTHARCTWQVETSLIVF